MYFVPFLRYSASNNGVTLKSGLEVVQDRWKWRRSIHHIRLTIGLPLFRQKDRRTDILCHLRVIWR